MQKQDAIKVAATYFPNYPSVDKFHVTKDSQVFEQPGSALNHARSLVQGNEQPIVVEVTRAEAEGKNNAANPEKEKAAKLKAAEKEVEKAQKAVESKQAAFEKAADDKKAEAEQALNNAKEALTKAESELKKLVEPAE